MYDRKRFITGGIGSQGYGESYREPYCLTHETCDQEISVGIALVFWIHKKYISEQTAAERLRKHVLGVSRYFLPPAAPLTRRDVRLPFECGGEVVGILEAHSHGDLANPKARPVEHFSCTIDSQMQLILIRRHPRVRLEEASKVRAAHAEPLSDRFDCLSSVAVRDCRRSFARWDGALTECKRLGLECHIYDENAFPAVRDSREIAIERPWLYQVTLNDQPLRFGKHEQWFDENIRKTSIAAAATSAKNTLRLTARPMHPLCEIMPVYVLGEFGLKAAPVGCTIVKPRPLKLGSWLKQRIPFYAGKVLYRYAFTLDEPTQRLAVSLPDWEGTLGELYLNDKPRGPVRVAPESA